MISEKDRSAKKFVKIGQPKRELCNHPLEKSNKNKTTHFFQILFEKVYCRAYTRRSRKNMTKSVTQT